MKHLVPLSILGAMIILAACTPRLGNVGLSDDPALNAFARQVQQVILAHDWEAVVARAEPGHYESQVGSLGMGEPQYVAELFGWNTVGNSVAGEGPITWADLERIREVALDAAVPVNGEYELQGTVRLDDGSRRDLRARITRTQTGFALTGAVG
ncbi:hypothetical protein BH23BAC4_BH23BAC4_11770 [soil metagenome]